MPEDEKKKHCYLKGYDSQHHVALRLLATWLDIQWIKAEAMEIMVACFTMAAAIKEEIQSQENESEKSKWAKWKRGRIIGAAALTGGALLALTGVLLAWQLLPVLVLCLLHALGTLVPIVGAGGFAAMAIAAGSVARLVVVASSFGGRHRALLLFLTYDGRDAMMTVLGTLVTVLAWPITLLAATDFIDSKWSIALNRSEKEGKLLAEVLTKGLLGYRPVTLVGFSLGARVIFKCLQKLAASGDSEGIVERVVLLDAPIFVNSENWESVRKNP
ncbi:uncharacterized membrane protein F35D11.3-like [Dioscorea cayenensis subsp. rotundata]|uniref:Uncharacterized membrane protein F35D11.3-like n=1 Tax=Dioscorea cayennensis subsp. rotundata TaxID=55577 RepID=A0AB40B2J1_DIOCR|nr:uncharacterized membrane protein F35D11.3-like [Dioscorea cayenensis subsp. rotundata]